LAGYPAGFLPLIDSRSYDVNSALGIKGTVAGWSVDLTGSYGRNKVAFRTENSANYAYGAASPHSFDDGALIYDQWVANLNVSKKFDVFRSLNVAWGLEGRREGYKIIAGERASYDYPPSGAVAGAAPGAQGFGGFSPLNAIKRSRRAGSLYLDVEAQVTDKLLIALAGRGETYSDFGEVVSGKASVRYDFSPHFALRGTVSNGFRAPSLQQQYFTSIASVITGGQVVLTGTFPSVNPTAVALGGKPLQPERSTNFSAGGVVRFGHFDLTVDGYYIKLRNEIALSENISASFSPAVAALLAPYNVSAARFFINGLASHTQGLDIVGHYRWRTDTAGTFDFTLASNINKIDITNVPTTTSALNPAPPLFARNRILTITNGTPGVKVTGTIDWSKGPLGATARATYYGNVLQPGTTVAGDAYTGRHTIFDLEARYKARRGLELALGAQNLADEYPRVEPGSLNAPSGVVGFPFYSPFGFNGRYLYVRAGVSW
ncbi:MAG: TonB-dependent receptor domain-containing protein, partial [Sphingomonas sp.]